MFSPRYVMIEGVCSARSDCTARRTSSMVSPGMKRDTSGCMVLLARTMRSMRLFRDAHSSEDLSGCILSPSILSAPENECGDSERHQYRSEQRVARIRPYDADDHERS